MKKRKINSATKREGMLNLTIPEMSAEEKELFQEKRMIREYNLVPDETMLQMTRKQLKEDFFDFYEQYHKHWDNFQWTFYEMACYYDWVLEKLGCEFDKSYSMEELKNRSGMDWNTFNTKIKGFEKW